MIPADARLTFRKIADHWSSELVPIDSARHEWREREILDTLIGAWWLGEIVGHSGTNRLDQLRKLFQAFGDEIVFELAGTRPPLKIERHGVAPGRRLTISVPSVDDSTWTDETCQTAFAVLADRWPSLRSNAQADPLFEPTTPILGYEAISPRLESIRLSRQEFLLWVKSKGIESPKFLGH